MFLLHNRRLQTRIRNPMTPRAPFVPPLALALLLSLVAFGVSLLHLTPLTAIPVFIAPLLCVTGAVLIITAFVQFRQHKTTVHPQNFSNTTALLATGLFSLSRNPIYLGMLLVMLGLATGLADGLAFIPSLIFFIWINNWQIPAEEFHLQRHFGVAYTDYCKKVRRWL